jgi:hypothetical protein
MCAGLLRGSLGILELLLIRLYPMSKLPVSLCAAYSVIKYLVILFVIFRIMDCLILLLAFGMIISSLFVYKYVAVRYRYFLWF